jgi:16S rRNA processing protein RimM
MITEDEVIKIGQFGKPHGIKGEITLIVTADIFDDEYDVPYVVCDMDGILVPFFIEDWRPKTKDTVLLKLEDVDDEEAARVFTGKAVYCAIEDVAEDVMDTMEWENFIGYEVIDTKLGPLGEIEDVDDSTINVLIKIDYKGKELLVPVADELIEDVNHDSRTLTVNIPEGLLDL